jgi:hypothetical protein
LYLCFITFYLHKTIFSYIKIISRFPHIALFASKPIKKGDVLGFDYGEKFWVIKHKFFTCWCGGDKCKYSKSAIGKTLETYYKNLDEEAEKATTTQQQHASSSSGGRLKLKLRLEEGKVVKVDDSGLLPDEPDRERRTPKLDELKKKSSSRQSGSGDESRKSSPKHEAHRLSPKLEAGEEDTKPTRCQLEELSRDMKPDLSKDNRVSKMEVGSTEQDSEESVEAKKRKGKEFRHSGMWKGTVGVDHMDPVVMLPRSITTPTKEIGKKIAKTQKLIDGIVDEIVSLTQGKNGGEGKPPGDIAAARAAVLKSLSSSSGSSSGSSPRSVLTPTPPPPSSAVKAADRLLAPPPPAVKAVDHLPPSSVVGNSLTDESAASGVSAPGKSAVVTAPPAAGTAVCSAAVANGDTTAAGPTTESPATVKRGRGRPKKCESANGKKLTESGCPASKPAVPVSQPLPLPPVAADKVTAVVKPPVGGEYARAFAIAAAAPLAVSGAAGAPVAVGCAAAESLAAGIVAAAVPLAGSGGSSSESRPSTPNESPGRPRRQRKAIEKDL